MHQRYFWQQFPVPMQRLRPWLLLSLALHAAVFSAPLLHSAAPTLPEPEATVSLAPAPPLPSAVVSPPALPTPTPQLSPQLPPQLIPQAPPVAVRPTPPQVATPAVPPASPTPFPAASPSPASVPSLEPVPSPSPEPPSPYATFPQIAGTTSGCGGREHCWQSANTQWRAIASTLEQELQTRGYDVSRVELEIETGMRVYRVSKLGEPAYYLNLISTFEQGTVYLISEQLMTVAEIRQAAAGKEEG